jgi:replicative DNA helicase
MMPPKKHVTPVSTLISVEEERSTLGAAMLDAHQARMLVRWAVLDDFACLPHRLIFAAMRRLEPPFEPAALAGELGRHGQLERAGGWNFLIDLDMGVVPQRPMSGRLNRLRELAHLRRLVRIGEELVKAPYFPGASCMEIARPIAQELSSWESAASCCDIEATPIESTSL